MTRDSLQHPGLLAIWATDLKAEAVTELTTAETSAVVDLMALSVLAAGAGGVGATAILQGGATMMNTTMTASAAAGLKAKIAAGALAAAVAAGGAAAVTGNLPQPAQRTVADLAAHIGLHLPGASVGIDANADARVITSDHISVESLGDIDVVLEANGVSVSDISTEAGVVASVSHDTADSVVVELSNGLEVATVLITREGDTLLTTIARSESEGSLGDSSTGASAGISVSGDVDTAPLDCPEASSSSLLDASSIVSTLGISADADAHSDTDASIECELPEADASVSGEAGTQASIDS